MKLTFKNRLKLCWEILTIKSGHEHSAFEKNLSSFQNGYRAGMSDKQYSVNENIKNHVRDNSITDLVTLIERFKDMRAFDAESPIELPKRRDSSPRMSDELENIKWASYCAGANDLIDTWCKPMVSAFNSVLSDMSNAEKELATLQKKFADSDIKPNPFLHSVVSKEFLETLIHDRDCIMEERDKLLSFVDSLNDFNSKINGEKNAEKK